MEGGRYWVQFSIMETIQPAAWLFPLACQALRITHKDVRNHDVFGSCFLLQRFRGRNHGVDGAQAIRVRAGGGRRSTEGSGF